MQLPEPNKTINILDFLPEAGELGKRIADFNWEATSLGPIESWPQSLRTCVHIMLSSRQPIWLGWGKDLIKLYNDPYKSIAGGKHPWALGNPASVVWKDIWRDIEPMLTQVMEKGIGTYVESQLLIMERNGYPEETYYTFSYTPVPGDDGKIAGMFCANTDDTERIINERQLKTLTQLGKQLVDCKTKDEVISKTIATLGENQYDFPFAIFRALDKNKLIFAQATELGESAAYVPLYYDLENDRGVIATTMKKALQTRKIQLFSELFERTGKMPKGAWPIHSEKVIVLPIFPTAVKEAFGTLTIGLNPYRLFDEKYKNFFLLVADQIATSLAGVSAFEEERKRAEALAAIDRAKTAFFSNISHELRTPLTLMLAPIEDTLNDPDTLPENKARINIAYGNARRLLKLVNTLLDFSRIEAGRMNARFECVNLSEITKDLVSGFRAAIEKSGMTLEVVCEEKTEGYIDTDMWEKIVLNLVSNAFKYTHHGQITVTLRQENGFIKFSVSDTGIGIPEEELEKVFERFHRVQNIGGRSQEGTGIGLALVQELVRLHGGSISVNSKINEGTTFSVIIPPGKDHLPPAQIVTEITNARQRNHKDIYVEEALKWLQETDKIPDNDTINTDKDITSPTGKSIQKPKLLIADDNADMREYLSRLLSKKYAITAVSNGRTALETTQTLMPDLILSDVMMPVLDGFELVRHLKADIHTKNIPVVLLSARAGEEATVEGLATGADDYLTKPFSAKELLSRIDSNLKIAEIRNNSVRQLYNLFMNAPVAIAILVGEELRFELANEKYMELGGRISIVGKTFDEAFPELKEKGIKKILDNVYKNSEPFYGNEFEINLVRQGKTEQLFFNFVYKPLKDLDDVTTGVMVIAIDVTEMVNARKLIEENEARLDSEVRKQTKELLNINIALERSNKELEQYAYVTSHDLQEPLRKIQIFNNMLREQINGRMMDEKAIRYTEKIADSAKRMTDLIKELLNFSTLSQEAVQFENINLDHVLDDVLKDIEISISEKGAVIDRMPLFQMDAIPLQMGQLFHNLSGNALKFAKTGATPVLKIYSEELADGDFNKFPSLERETKYGKIIFEDNGIGFNQAFGEKIFTIFQRLNNRSSFGGHGIGLAICKKVVENHKGVIYAEGRENEGAIFTIILPLKH